MQPVLSALLLTFTVFDGMAALVSALCALSAIVIVPVTAVHTVAARYDLSYIILVDSLSEVLREAIERRASLHCMLARRILSQNTYETYFFANFRT